MTSKIYEACLHLQNQQREDGDTHHTTIYGSSECSDVPYAATRAVDPRLRVTVGHMRV